MQRALTGVVSRGDFVVPPYPAVALRLQRLLARDNYNISDVADIIAADVALAATVLGAANSALLGAAAPITSLSRAVNRLGARTVGAIAIASGVGTATLATGVLIDVRFRVWRHNMTTALICQKLGSSRGVQSEDAFLGGLLYGFGRAIAIASLEQLLKTQPPARPLLASEWLKIAEQHRAALANAIAKSWQLPAAIANAMDTQAEAAGSPLSALVLYADQVARALDAGRTPEAETPSEVRLLDELIAGLPAALEAFAPTALAPTTRPSPPSILARPDRALEGELRQKTIEVVDGRSKTAATLDCLRMGPTGLELSSSRAFQESTMVRLQVGPPEARFQPWFSVVLCEPTAGGFRVELELFSPTRETREQWRLLYEAP